MTASATESKSSTAAEDELDAEILQVGRKEGFQSHLGVDGASVSQPRKKFSLGVA